MHSIVVELLQFLAFSACKALNERGGLIPSGFSLGNSCILTISFSLRFRV